MEEMKGQHKRVCNSFFKLKATMVIVTDDKEDDDLCSGKSCWIVHHVDSTYWSALIQKIILILLAGTNIMMSLLTVTLRDKKITKKLAILTRITELGYAMHSESV
jgi:hypothetical protein